ncbi:LysR family transcriptional regulator [Arthrobacter sp. NPDC058127]|uniref:LysR family transcriptional regulator n=1 Tax=Arthrobacter sp. NPDC058127 TaxID=3346351 RepID=UPI0036DFF37D
MQKRNLGNVDLNLLVPLQSLLRHRNVSRAAESLGMSQPAMSNSLRRLRSLLDDQLLVRIGNKYELTARAAGLQGRVDELLNSLTNQILEQPGFEPAESNRRFVVGASASTAITALRPVMKSLEAVAPGISFKAMDLPRDPDSILGGQEVDLILVPEHLPVEHPRERLYQEEWVIIASTDNPLARTPLKRSTLSAAPFAVYEQDGLRVHAMQLLAAEGIHVQSRFICDNFLTMMHTVEESELLAVIQGSIARRYATSSNLVILDSPVPFRPFGIDMVWNPRNLDDPAITWLRDQFRSYHQQPARTRTGYSFAE